MISEQLIRSGQAFIEGNSSSRDLLFVLSDSGSETTKNYWQHVLIVEVSNKQKNYRVHSFQRWGSQYSKKVGQKTKKDFSPEEKVIHVPFFMPTGGNPTVPQGFYGLPVYPVWNANWESFIKSPANVQEFLSARFKRTTSMIVSEEILPNISEEIHKNFKTFETDQKKPSAVIIIALEDGDSFLWSDTDTNLPFISASSIKKEMSIYADPTAILDQVWRAKLREGEEKGTSENGVCAYSNHKGKVVSGDNKAWGWFTTTWEAPFPEQRGKKDYFKSLAFSPEIYKYLTVGACLFSKFTKTLDFNLNKQLFAPVDSAGGRETASKGQVKSTVFGSAVVTPLLDVTQLDEIDKERFAFGLQQRLEGGTRGAKLLLSNLLGYDDFIPDEMTSDQFRLTSFYFSGDPSRADIHLHATIEDVIPSVLKRIDEIVGDGSQWSSQFYSDAQAWLQERMKSLPYLLVTAYGPAALWHNLSSALHNEKLAWQPFVRGIAQRCNELSHNLADNNLTIRNEAAFYAIFRRFFQKYHDAFDLERRTMRTWQELVANISTSSIPDIQFHDVEEYGFAAGYLVRQFANQYYAATDKKDFLQHRVMSFGSSLTPETIHHKALAKLPEYAQRIRTRLSEDFEQRVGVWVSSYPQWRSDIKKQDDDFMAAFWAGYMLGRVK